MTHRNNVKLVFFYALLTAVGVITFLIFMPYLITLAMATTFAVIVQPLYRAQVRMTRGRETIAAVCTIVITAILLLAPLTLLGMQVAQEAKSLYELISSQQEVLSIEFLTNIEQAVERFVGAYVPGFNVDVESVIRQSLTWLSAYIGPVFTNTVSMLVHILLGIIAFFYLVRDGDGFLKSLTELSPLADYYDRRILARLSLAINSIIKGSLLIALIQGIISGIGFAIFGIPSATLWGSAAAIGALVPGVGSAIVIIPAVIYLFITGGTFAAIGLAVWGMTAVGLIDNFLGPVLVGKGVRIHPLFILFAVLGGLSFFGPLGFILGPLTLSLLYALLDIYTLISTEKK